MIKQIILLGYFVPWILTALYQTHFGEMAYRGFLYNFVRTIFWMDFWFDTNVAGVVIGNLFWGYLILKTLKR